MLNEVLRLKQLHHTWIVNMAISLAAYKVLVNKYFIKTSVKWEHSRFIKCKFIWPWKMYSIWFLFRISNNGSFLKELKPQLNFKHFFFPFCNYTHTLNAITQWLSKYGLQTSSLSIPREIVRVVNSSAHPRLSKSDTLG